MWESLPPLFFFLLLRTLQCFLSFNLRTSSPSFCSDSPSRLSPAQAVSNALSRFEKENLPRTGLFWRSPPFAFVCPLHGRLLSSSVLGSPKRFSDFGFWNVRLGLLRRLFSLWNLSSRTFHLHHGCWFLFLLPDFLFSFFLWFVFFFFLIWYLFLLHFLFLFYKS